MLCRCVQRYKGTARTLETTCRSRQNQRHYYFAFSTIVRREELGRLNTMTRSKRLSHHPSVTRARILIHDRLCVDCPVPLSRLHQDFPDRPPRLRSGWTWYDGDSRPPNVSGMRRVGGLRCSRLLLGSITWTHRRTHPPLITTDTSHLRDGSNFAARPRFHVLCLYYTPGIRMAATV